MAAGISDGPVATCAGTDHRLGVLGTFLTLLAAAFCCTWIRAGLVCRSAGRDCCIADRPRSGVLRLGRQEIAGRSGTILEGESGANDPVGIALMGGLLAAGGLSGAAFGSIAIDFVLQMAIGVAAGVAGGIALLAFMRRVSLPSEALYRCAPSRACSCCTAQRHCCTDPAFLQSS